MTEMFGYPGPYFTLPLTVDAKGRAAFQWLCSVPQLVFLQQAAFRGRAGSA